MNVESVVVKLDATFLSYSINFYLEYLYLYLLRISSDDNSQVKHAPANCNARKATTMIEVEGTIDAGTLANQVEGAVEKVGADFKVLNPSGAFEEAGRRLIRADD